MKKYLMILGILATLIGLGFSIQPEKSSMKTKIESKNLIDACICPSCNVELQKTHDKVAKYMPCYNCGGDGKVTGIDKEPCRECNATGKQKCNSNDGRNRYDRWTHCNNCSVCRGTRYRDVQKANFKDCTSSNCKKVTIDGNFKGYGSIVYDHIPVLQCPRCKRNYSGC